MKKILTILAFLSLFCLEGRAQFASLGSEKGSTQWESYNSANYKVIFPVGLDSLGLRYSQLLEQYRPLVGLSAGFFPNQQYKKPMPVVLHPYATVSNGAVVWSPRRMDLYTFPDAYAALPPVPWEKILAIHENRHVAQLQFTRSGFWRGFYWPFGEIAFTLVGSLYANQALLEGDAVVAETALTQSGRGRSADFLSYIRMSFANGDMRDWYRWRYGSQRRYTPDYYRIGYMTVAGMRYKYDAPLFMRSYLKDLRSPFAFNAVRKSMVKYSDKGINKTWKEIAESFRQQWALDDSLRAPFQEPVPLVASTRYFTSFKGGVQTKDGRVFSLRTALDKSQELVQLLPDGSVKVIRSMSADSRLAYSPATDCLYWSEAVPDLRWDMAQTSRIRYVRAGDNKIRDLATGRFVNPAVSPDGKRMAAAEYPLGGGSRIVLLDIMDGKLLHALTVPDGLQVTEVAFLGDDIVFTGISDEGMGLYLTDGTEICMLEAPVPVKIKHLVSHEGTLYFTCDRTGTNEVYAYTPGSLTQLTNTRHGVSCPFFRDGVLCVSALGTSGSLPSRMDAPLSRRVSLADYASYPIADCLSAQEKALAKASEEVQEEPKEAVKARYSKAKNFFHIHSWLPMYYNWGSFSSTETNYFYETASLGATAFFQNLTGTASGSLGLSFHADPFDTDKPAAGFHTRLKYTGLYPVLDFALDVGDRQAANLSRAWIPSKDSLFLAAKPTGGIFVGGSLGVSLPLNLSSGGRETTLEPSITLKYSNDAIGEGLSIYAEDAVTELHQSVAGGMLERTFTPNLALVARFTADTRRTVAPSQVLPRFGVGGELRGIITSMKGGLGSGMYLNAYAYLPGLTSLQGLKLSASFQSRGQGFWLTSYSGGSAGYMLPMDVWAMGFEDMAPRGFEKTGIGATMLMFSSSSALMSLDYVMPLLFVDRAITPYFYLSNLEINPFADCSLFSPDGLEYLYSVGADIVLRFEKFLAVSNTLKLGARVAYNGGSDMLYQSTGLESPVYVGVVINSTL